MPKKKRKPWRRFRHRIVRNIAFLLLYPYMRFKYHIRIDRFREKEKRNYLILCNHQTPFDQFFLGVSFRGPIYYLATEDIFSNGWISSLIRYLIAPIPIMKQTVDVKAVLTCMRVAKEGGTIAIAPEGNRTYSGRTEYMNPAITALVRKLRLPLLLYRIEGGYGAEPRWSDVVRKGKMHSYVARVLEPSEYDTLSDEALYNIIKDGLYVNEAVADRPFYHKRRAEYLERLLYICPDCGLSTFQSKGARLTCKVCGLELTYSPTKELSALDGRPFPFRFVADWYDYQEQFINTLDTREYTDAPLYTDTVRFSEVIPYKKKLCIHKRTTVRLYGDRIEVGEGDARVFRFAETAAVTVLGKNKANIYFDGHIFQLKGNKRFCAIKYVHIFHRDMNIRKGNEYGKFLGL